MLLGHGGAILVASLLRKRLFQGITMALYGLAVFNLRFWGFGVPFLLAGAWYLVRAYRLQQALKRAEAAERARPPEGHVRARATPRPRPQQALHASDVAPDAPRTDAAQLSGSTSCGARRVCLR